jgi:hypothetical protein
MHTVRTLILFALAASAFPMLCAQAPDRWLTAYELSGHRVTPRYDETLRYCRRLDSASSWVTLTSFGTSPQGRQLPLLIVSKQGVDDPRDPRRAGIPVVLIQAGIHAGEIDGKDAGLMLVRDMAITRSRSSLLDSAIVLFIPIFNVDGHERFGPFNRINQNGPEEMGWRVTARNLNLNRDYLKADAPEMRALLRLFAAWEPDLYVDCHVTDGIDFQYDVTYTTETGPQIDARVGAWISHDFLPGMLSGVERAGHRIFWYVFPREEKDLTRGMNGGASPPRFSTGYAALRNRAALLIETHVYKSYRTRVAATYAVLTSALERVNRTASVLRSAVRVADEAQAGLGRRGATVPLTFGLDSGSVMREFLGYRSFQQMSAISGSTRLVYSDEPVVVRMPFYGGIRVTDSVEAPKAYLIPPEWSFVPEILRVHGIRMQRLRAPATVEVGSYRFRNPRWKERPYEGRHGLTVTADPIRERRTFGAGTVVVPSDQPAMRVVVQLLEPRSADSFVAWGFFDAVFEQKEYFEQEVMERVGERMLATDSLLRAAFFAQVGADSAFAADPDARLNWLYQRSPYRDGALNVYPVGRFSGTEPLELEPLP